MRSNVHAFALGPKYLIYPVKMLLKPIAFSILSDAILSTSSVYVNLETNNGFLQQAFCLVLFCGCFLLPILLLSSSWCAT